MGGQNQHLGNLYVLGGVGGKNGNIGYIVTSQRLDACVEFLRTLFITLETHVAEISLHESGLQVRHADSGIGYVDAQTI